jgi:hypothetical protein
MKNIADLLLRVWQRSQPASNTQVAAMAENRIDPAWPILSASCKLTIKTATAQLGATTSLGLFENLDAGIRREPHHHVVVDV